MNAPTGQDGGWGKVLQAIYHAVDLGCSVTISKSEASGYVVERDGHHVKVVIPNYEMQERIFPGDEIAEKISMMALQVFNCQSKDK